MTRFAILAGACLALAACGEKTPADTQVDETATARGEVLGGSISDDMLPLDTITSQSPPLREAPAAESGTASSPDSEAEPQEEPEAPEEPAPSQEAEPESPE